MEVEGAQPRIPGWMRPGNRTWGIWREEQNMPSKSQMAFALFVVFHQHSIPFPLQSSYREDNKTYASGYNSSKNPPPFSFAKIPEKPQG
jgi:hypothetical protein